MYHFPLETHITNKVPIYFYSVYNHKPKKCVTLQLVLLQGYSAIIEAFQVSLGANTWTRSVDLPFDGHIYMNMCIPSSTFTQRSKAII